MNTLFPIEDNTAPTLFAADRQDIVTMFADGRLEIRFSIKFDRNAESVLRRVMQTIPGIKACNILDTPNSTAALQFQDIPGILSGIENIRAEARSRAESFLNSEINRPAQTSLF